MAYADKEQELEDLTYFLRARQSAIGEQLSVVCDGEAPDFICRRPNGALIGVEHTRVIYNPERDDVLIACHSYDPDSDNFEILYDSAVALANKEAKRRKPHWKHATETILVLDLVNRFRLEEWPEDNSLASEFSDAGFIEVWISDHASIETHGEVTAIGLFPKEIWGIRGQGYLGAPPYK
ncbi:MAG TPA: hypothetical protein VIH54_19820 [Chthoniobacterales bacterium]